MASAIKDSDSELRQRHVGSVVSIAKLNKISLLSNTIRILISFPNCWYKVDFCIFQQQANTSPGSPSLLPNPDASGNFHYQYNSLNDILVFKHCEINIHQIS